ncbi:MAG: head-tail connector protein [Ahrensia sp.]|nr:head-tail connector protein [Ahrensia sp.]
MTIAQIVAPAVEPLTLAEVKAHLRIDHDHEDTLLADTLSAARQYAETMSGQRFITQQWRQYESEMPQNRCVALHLSPVQSVVAVTAFDREGVPQVLAQEDYVLEREGLTLTLSSAVSHDVTANGLEVDLQVGIGDAAGDIPQLIKRAVLMLVAHWYEFRGAVSAQDQPVSLPPGFEAVLNRFRRFRL